MTIAGASCHLMALFTPCPSGAAASSVSPALPLPMQHGVVRCGMPAGPVPPVWLWLLPAALLGTTEWLQWDLE